MLRGSSHTAWHMHVARTGEGYQASSGSRWMAAGSTTLRVCVTACGATVTRHYRLAAYAHAQAHPSSRSRGGSRHVHVRPLQVQRPACQLAAPGVLGVSSPR
jgi:hypothetical protein